MYKGHQSRKEYLHWCQTEWRKHHPLKEHEGERTIDEYVEQFTLEGAVGVCDVLGMDKDENNGGHLFMFTHLLPATAGELARAFAAGLSHAVQAGYVDWADGIPRLPAESEAPISNTGLGLTDCFD